MRCLKGSFDTRRRVLFNCGNPTSSTTARSFESISKFVLSVIMDKFNFSMDSKSCFSLVLLGQPVLNSILMRQPHEALCQRIIINYNFTGIQESEAVEYIKDRFTLAGASPSIIDDNAMLSAYGSSSGSIRRLNLIITKALIIGAQHNKQIIDTDIILAAVNEIQLM